MEGSYTSLPFGDGYAATGTDQDPYHYAQLDSDPETGTAHAQFRQYSSTQGRWMRPDPYYGSYVFTNPESFNRYAYVGNNPLGSVDPAGMGSCEISSDPDCMDGGAGYDGSGGNGGDGYGIAATPPEIPPDGFIYIGINPDNGTLIYEDANGNRWYGLPGIPDPPAPDPVDALYGYQPSGPNPQGGGSGGGSEPQDLTPAQKKACHSLGLGIAYSGAAATVAGGVATILLISPTGVSQLVAVPTLFVGTAFALTGTVGGLVYAHYCQ